MREWIHWESANNGVLLEYKASCWENGESWRTELTKWISHLLKGSRMLRDPKNPVHSIASCPRSIALRTHFNGNHFDRKFSESHIFLFLLLNPHTTTKTRKKIGWKNYLQQRRHHRTPTSRWGSCRGGTRSWRSYLSHISTSWKIFPHHERIFSHPEKKIVLHHEQILSQLWKNIFTSHCE